MSSKHKKNSRRRFLIRSAQTTAGIIAAGSPISKAASSVIGANERINVAVIGIRGQGRGHINDFAEMDNVRVKTICDVDERLFPECVKMAKQIQDTTPRTEHDLRRICEDKDIHAVSVATCNHWHALATIWACQAGKHVYVEKPCSHNIWEGQKMIEAARKYNCLVQVGTQRRSMRNIRRAMKFLHDGGLGEVYMARGLCLKSRGDYGKQKEVPVPDGVHFDLWLGPAPLRPFYENRFHYNWHWYWDTGNGDIGNTGPHQLDVASWGLGNDHEFPVKVRSIGGFFKWDSTQKTPNVQTVVYEYADGKILQFEVRGLYTNYEENIHEGNLFFGTKGWMSLGGRRYDKWETYLGRKNEPGPTSETIDECDDRFRPGGDHHESSFIWALRSGKRENLTCDIEVGNKSAVLPHLANISYRLGRDLTFDCTKQKFVGDTEADAMLTREYRKPYVVPENV